MLCILQEERATMTTLDVFVSVGGTATAEQEAFIRAVEDRLRSEGLVLQPSSIDG